MAAPRPLGALRDARVKNGRAIWMAIFVQVFHEVQNLQIFDAVVQLVIIYVIDHIFAAGVRDPTAVI